MIYQSKKTTSIILTFLLVAQLGAVAIMPLLLLLLPGLSETSHLGIAMIASFLIALCMMIFLLRNEIRDNLSQKKSWKAILLYGSGGFLIAVLLQNILIPLITLIVDGPVSTESEKMLTEMAQVNWLFIVVPALIGPILEEIVFRYAILGTLMKRMKTSDAVIISSILFGLAHFSPINMIIYVVLGIVFSIIYIRTKSLMAPIIAHVLLNSMVMILYLFGLN